MFVANADDDLYNPAVPSVFSVSEQGADEAPFEFSFLEAETQFISLCVTVVLRLVFGMDDQVLKKFGYMFFLLIFVCLLEDFSSNSSVAETHLAE